MVTTVTQRMPGLPVGHPLMQPKALTVRRVLSTLVLPANVERVAFLIGEDHKSDVYGITLVASLTSGVVLHQGMFLSDSLLSNGSLKPVLESTVGEMLAGRLKATA